MYVVGDGSTTHKIRDQMNIESVDLKPNPINSCTHNRKSYSQQQPRTTPVADFGEVNKHVWSENSHGLEDHIL
jgi:hypothetical protein